MNDNDVKREQARSAECPARHRLGCAAISADVGLHTMFPMNWCDTCWAKGGLYTDDAESFRAARAKFMRDRLLEQKNLDRPSLVALLVRGVPPAKRQYVIEESAVGKGAAIAQGWRRARHSWSDASNFIKSIGSRLITGVVDTPTRERRILSCFGKRSGEQVQPPCTQLKVSEKTGHYYCGACGCGDSKLALFTVEGEKYDKLDYPYLVCPLGREGFSNERVPEEALQPGTDTLPDVGSGEDGA